MNIKNGALKYFSLEKVLTIYNKNVKAIKSLMFRFQVVGCQIM